MKTAIRKGVFETNSSSTHALSIKKSKSKRMSKDASFEIRSKEAKIVQLFGLINNAEYDYYSGIYQLEEPQTLIDVRKIVVDTLKKKCPSMLDGYNPENLNFEELCDIVIKMEASIDFYDCFFGVNKYGFELSVLNFLIARSTVLKFKEILIDTYAEITKLSKEKALEQIDFEAFSNKYLKSILDNEEKLNDYKLENYDFGEAFINSGSTDIVEFAKQYYVEDCENFKSMSGNKIRCDVYFNEGCLSDCYCGMEAYTCIQSALKINCDDSDEVLKQKAYDFLSDETKFVAKEYWNGLCLEKTGDIY